MDNRRIWVAASWIVGGAAMTLGATRGHALGIFISLPVICSAWFYLFRGATIAAIVCLPFTMLCLELGGLDSIASLRANVFIPIGHGLAAIVGFMFAYLQRLRHRLERETQLRLDSERAQLQAELEARLLRTNRLVTVGTLAAGVAHEINNQLTFLLGNVELLLDELDRLGDRAPDTSSWPPLRDKLREGLSDARIGAEHIGTIVRELKLFVRERSSQDRGPVALEQVIETAIMLSRHELGPGVEIVTRLDPVPTIHGDAGKLCQVFINLIINASQAMPPGRERSCIHIELGREGDELVAAVRDDGMGMSEEVQRRVFEPFFTTKPVGVGTGLGLAVCADIIRDHAAKIELDSEPGRGTTFRLRFGLDAADYEADYEANYEAGRENK